MTVDLATATWTEVERAERRVLVVPLGALEQHGPHLPLDTDTRIAVHVARAAAGGRCGVAVAPALPLGASGEHADFPGTLSIGTQALTGLLVELVRDACRDWDGVLVVNGHGGNKDAVASALGVLAAEGRRCRVFHVRPESGDAHAGHVETSILLALDPGSVRLDAAEPGETRPLAELLPLLRRVGVRRVSGNGVLGDPSTASAAEGRRLLEELASACAASLDELLAAR